MPEEMSSGNGGFPLTHPPAKHPRHVAQRSPPSINSQHCRTFASLREPLRAICVRLGLKGSVLLAHEGINGTLAGHADAIDEMVDELQHGALFGGRLDRLELKFSLAVAMPFRRLKIRLKKEIVTLGDAKADPTRQVGIYVEPAEWNALIAAPDTLVIDTRNSFEVATGHF